MFKGLKNEICVNSFKSNRFCLWNDARFCMAVLAGGYLTSAILLGSPDENREDSIIWDYFDNNNDFWNNDSFFNSFDDDNF